jgi:hypothetical protein
MKKLILSVAVVSLMLHSCSTDDNEVIAVKKQVTGEISGDITSNKTYELGDYTIKGYVKIKSGTTVIFDAGSKIVADGTDGTDALVIENGGKLIVNGTAAEPVVFTEKSETPGSWGGIIMYGDAPISAPNGATTATSEDGLAMTYGGTNPNHNGGSLKYVRVEYAGKKIADGTKELNGFSFYSVGSGTVLENLVSYKGADDGYEFYGGNVSLKNAISYGNFDDAFDWQDGWRGQENINWYGYQSGTANFGLEVEARGVNNDFWPVVSNITLIREQGTLTENGSVEYDAIQFKKEGNGVFRNIVIEGYNDPNAVVVRIQDASTNTNQVNGKKISIQNIKRSENTPVYGAGAKSFSVAFPLETLLESTSATGASITVGNWSNVNGLALRK